jgi:hypothetical protein
MDCADFVMARPDLADLRESAGRADPPRQARASVAWRDATTRVRQFGQGGPMKPNDSRPRRPVAFAPAAEGLETRQVLSAGAGNTIAILPGQISEAGKPVEVHFTVDPASFTIPRGRLALGLDVVPASSASTVKPLIAAITDAQGRHVQHATYGSPRPVQLNGQDISPAHVMQLNFGRARRGAPAPAARPIVAHLLGADQNTGPILAGVYLIGDANGDGKVDRTDLDAIRKALGTTANDSGYAFDADANRDGRISAIDLKLAQMNLGAKSTILPLVTADLDPASDTGPADRITGVQNVKLTGIASAGATITYTETSGKTPTVTTTADADGHYSVTIPLAVGENVFKVTSTDALAQTISGTIAPITYKPELAAATQT